MAFPVNLDNSIPANTESPSLGAARIRAILGNLQDLFGIPQAVNITAALMSLGSLTDGKLATLPVVKGASPFQRFIGTEGSAKDVRLIEDAGVVKIQANTGTEAVPVWTEVYRFAWGANFAGRFTHTNTADRTYTFQDANATLEDTHAQVLAGQVFS